MRTNVLRGMLFGLGLAVLYSAWVLVLATVTGWGAFVAENGIHPLTLVLAYLGGGLAGGAVGGGCISVLPGWGGAMVTGPLAALPVFLSFCLLDEGPAARCLGDVWLICVILGIPGGLIVYVMWRRIDPFGPLD